MPTYATEVKLSCNFARLTFSVNAVEKLLSNSSSEVVLLWASILVY